MWQKVGNIVLVTLLWAAVAAYMGYAGWLAHMHRTRQTVVGVDVRIVDSTANDRLVTSRRVREWIARSGIPTIGVPMKDANIAGVRRLIEKNGFIERANVYVTWNGVMHIDISQRNPVMRIIAKGHDMYVTADGFVFPAPEESALYVPVVSGDYVPFIPRGFEGYASDLLARLRGESALRMGGWASDRMKLKQRDRAEVKLINSRRTDRFRRKWGWFENAERYAERKEAFYTIRNRYVEEHRAIRRSIADSLKRISLAEERERGRMLMQERMYDDLCGLTRFVERFSDDAFWSGEIVQTELSRSEAGEMEAVLIPRSGDFRIDFGALDNPEPRFDRLMRFYRKGLGSAGWDKYRIINVRYNNQVVCTR